MKPIGTLDRATARSVRVVLTDIDDTLTEHGRLPPEAHAALRDLRQDGLLVVPVTGRPAGWCDLIARQWYVDGVVGENGALWFRYDEAAGRLIKVFARNEAQRRTDRRQLDLISAEVLKSVPGSAPASDQDYRVSDLAIDYCEDVPRLPAAAVDRIVGIFHAHGAVAKVSSIHVNGWFGAHDKLTTTLSTLQSSFGIDGRADRNQVMFVGDSPNDATMFGHFPNSVGVANVARFASTIEHLPGFVTEAAFGRGFVEFATSLLSLRRN